MYSENNESEAHHDTLREVLHKLSADSWEPWKLSITEVADRLAVDPSVGLNEQEVPTRLDLFGENLQINLKRRLEWYQFVLLVCRDPIIILLIAVVGLYLFWGERVEAITAVVVIIFALGLELLIDWKANITINSLSKEVPENIMVVRGGHEHIVVSRNLVPGDIVIITQGQRVPVDGVLINCRELGVDESLFTGENGQVPKSSLYEASETEDSTIPSGYVCSGSVVTKGKGVLLATATGKHTRLATIQNSTISENEKTPLQILARSLTRYLSILGLLVSIILPAISIMKGKSWCEALLAGIGLAIATIPGALLSLIDIILVVSSQELSRKNLLIRNLKAAESLGSVSAIVTDKSGTLTSNILRVSSAIVLTRPDQHSDQSFQICCRRIAPSSNKDMTQYLLPLTILWALSMDQFACDKLFQLVREGDTTSSVDHSPLPLATGIDKDTFDSAIFELFNSSETSMEVQRYLIRSALLVFSRFPVPIYEVPFDILNRVSFRTRGSTSNKNSGNKITIVRGAPETILNLCDRIWVSGYEKECSENEVHHHPTIDTEMLNDVEVLTGYITSKLIESFNDVARKGRRVLAYAYSTTSHAEGEEPPNDFIFAGAYVFSDPVREEIPDAIKECQNAGIRVVMATSDHPETALAVASYTGISAINSSNEPGRILLGQQLDSVASNALVAELVKKTDVFARLSPDNKLRIVRSLQAEGHVVAFIGDGINDISALNTADVGIIIGGVATTADIALDHASLVILGHRFEAVVYCLREGRRMLENINKAITFYLASKLALTSLFTLVFVIRGTFPLKTIHIILLELFVNLGASITYVIERAESNIMLTPPPSMNRPKGCHGAFKSSTGLQIIYSATLLFLSTGSSYLYGAIYDTEKRLSTTMLFISFLVNHLVLGFVLRSNTTPIRKQGLFTNRNFLLWLGLVLGFILLYVFVSTIRLALDLSTLNKDEWIVIMTGAGLQLIISEVWKELRWQYFKCERALVSSEQLPLLSN
ncbi:hypothetical protein K7432_011314 [Basidiobolus ranarum]|uniref:Cation-transporting P-type ATPase N-terminal domain-containing protein n=1 Tax=Basidiobolus ranarum TaxID=34480 RepID=A0ABR2WMF8_9FUNG